MLEGASLLPGAIELLAALRDRGTICAVFTNKLGVSARAVCAHLGLSPYVRGVYGAKDTAWLKPQPAFAAYVLKDLAAKLEGTVLVGDSPFDVDAARQGGFGFVGVTTGTHTEDQLRAAGATSIFPTLVEVRSAWLG